MKVSKKIFYLILTNFPLGSLLTASLTSTAFKPYLLRAHKPIEFLFSGYTVM